MEEQERKTPELAEQEFFYGIKESDINEEKLNQILKIYVQTVGGAEWMLNRDWLTDLQNQLRDAPIAEVRLGSRLSGDSRFYAQYHYIADKQKIVTFGFAAQLQQIKPTRKILKEANKLESSFKKAVSNYLKNSGLGIPVQQQ